MIPGLITTRMVGRGVDMRSEVGMHVIVVGVAGTKEELNQILDRAARFTDYGSAVQIYAKE